MPSKTKTVPVVLVMGHDKYRNLFLDQGWDIATSAKATNIDLVCFTGGADINPDLYGESYHRSTQVPDNKRDTTEISVFELCKEQGIPMVGICRGAQLLCVLNGGMLVQNISGHKAYHDIVTEEGKMHVSSSHHQMMYPWNVNHILLGYSIGVSKIYQGKDKHKREYAHTFPIEATTVGKLVKEPEVVLFQNTRSLAHQAHPEWMAKESTYCKYFFNTLHKYLGVG